MVEKNKNNMEEMVEEVKAETENKKETKKIQDKKIAKKDKAVANGFGLRISAKQSKYVCKIIKGKSPEVAVARLQDVIYERRPVPMAGLEVAHRRGKGLAGARWPKNTCKVIMEIVKQAGANAAVAGIEAPVISVARSDQASAPYKSDGRKAKRAHIHIEVIEKTKLIRRKK
jgi:ribosomal protein L22